MSLNPMENQIVNKKKEQQNVPSTTKQKFLPSTRIIVSSFQDTDISIVNEHTIQTQDSSDVLSYIPESISKEELTVLISYLKQKQPILNITLPNLERKKKIFQLTTREVQRQELLYKYPTAKQLLRQQQLQEQEELYGSINILGDSLLEYNVTESPCVTHNKPRIHPHKKREVLTPEEKEEREQLRRKQLQEQEDTYGSMNILGDSLLEYDLTEVPYVTHNKPRKQPHKKIVITPEQKMEQEQLRQIQLQGQENLYDQIDLLGETILEFSPLQPITSFSKNIEQQVSHAHTIISISPDDEIKPQTSSGPRRVSKYLSPEQVAQLAKIRKQRYEQQERVYLEEDVADETVPNVLKEHYSFRQPNARLRSPRELAFRKSIVNVEKNKEKHSKSLALPVMNFPPTNWPTPIIPEIRQELDKLRQEQREYFLAMQQAQAVKKTQNQNENKDPRESNIQGQTQTLHATQNLNERLNENKDPDDELNLSSIKYHHKFINYVFIILCVQWLLITGILSLFKYHEPSALWLDSSGEWSWLYVLISLIIVIISFLIFPITRNIFPINLMMLILFSLLVAFLFSFVGIYYPNDAVLMALTCTCIICVVLTLFFCQTIYNFTAVWGLSLCIIIILFILAFFYVFMEVIILDIIYAATGVLLYSIYLVYDTRLILTERRFQIEFENCILGAIHLNLDFVFIMIEKLQHI